MKEERFDALRKIINPWMRKLFGLAFCKIQNAEGIWIGIGIRNE